MINVLNQIWREFALKPRCVLHIGANKGQEARLYHDMDIEAYHVEAIPDIFEFLQTHCQELSGQEAINALLDSEAGQPRRFYVASNDGQSSSMFDLGRHQVAYPQIGYTNSIILKTETLDGLFEDKIEREVDFLVIDAQGAEMRIFEGGANTLSSNCLWGVYVEVSLDRLYEGGACFDEILMYLKSKQFFLHSVSFNRKGWSDALFLRRWWLDNHFEQAAPLSLAAPSLPDQKKDQYATALRERFENSHSEPYQIQENELTRRIAQLERLLEREEHNWLPKAFRKTVSINGIRRLFKRGYRRLAEGL